MLAMIWRSGVRADPPEMLGCGKLCVQCGDFVVNDLEARVLQHQASLGFRDTQQAR